MIKRGKEDKQRESMVASYRYLGVSNPGLQMIGSNECDVSCLNSTRPLIPVYQKNSCTLLFSGLRSSWNLVNPLLSMNEAWMDVCAARLQPLVDQYKTIQHQTFATEKFRDLIVTTRSCPWVKKISFKKYLVCDCVGRNMD